MNRSRRQIALFAAAALASLVVAAPVSAQSGTVYHPDTDSREFAGSVGGWTSSTGTGGLCIAQPLLCPSVTNTFEASGGIGGATDGHVRTATGGVAGVSGAVLGVWESPDFIYGGAAGSVPDSLQFGHYRRAAVADLINAGGRAVYRIEIVDAGSGAPQVVLTDNTLLTDSPEWETPGLREISPQSLAVGESYRFRITTRFEFGPQAIPTTTVDYDSVALAAIDEPEVQGPTGPQGPSGPRGPRGPSGSNGSDGDDGKFDVAFLNSFVKNNMRNWTGVRRREMLVLVRCPGRARQKGRFCSFGLTALARRRGPAASKARTVRIPPKGRRLVRLPLRRPFHGEITKREQILVRYRVRVGTIRTTVFKQLRVVSCRRAAVC